MGATYTFSGKKMIFVTDKVRFVFTFELRPDKKPKELDMTSKLEGEEETTKEIYELSGDTLKICGSGPEQPRPASIGTATDDDRHVWVLKRVKGDEQEAAIAAIKKLDSMEGSVYFASRNGTVSGVDFHFTKGTDAGLEHLKALKILDSLHVTRSDVTDAGLKHLKGLTGLRSVVLSETNITDAGLEHLKGLTGLRWLGLRDTNITNAGLVHLKGMTKLQYLYLGNTKITDAGLEHLNGLTNLENLWLNRTKVSEAGLKHLKGLTKLRYLNLWDTNVTSKGVKKLKKALPNCEIVHSRSR